MTKVARACYNSANKKRQSRMTKRFLAIKDCLFKTATSVVCKKRLVSSLPVFFMVFMALFMQKQLGIITISNDVVTSNACGSQDNAPFCCNSDGGAMNEDEEYDECYSGNDDEDIDGDLEDLDWDNIVIDEDGCFYHNGNQYCHDGSMDDEDDDEFCVEDYDENLYVVGEHEFDDDFESIMMDTDANANEAHKNSQEGEEQVNIIKDPEDDNTDSSTVQGKRKKKSKRKLSAIKRSGRYNTRLAEILNGSLVEVR